MAVGTGVPFGERDSQSPLARSEYLLFFLPTPLPLSTAGHFVHGSVFMLCNVCLYTRHLFYAIYGSLRMISHSKSHHPTLPTPPNLAHLPLASRASDYMYLGCNAHTPPAPDAASLSKSVGYADTSKCCEQSRPRGTKDNKLGEPYGSTWGQPTSGPAPEK
jgi:hypothetical protein